MVEASVHHGLPQKCKKHLDLQPNPGGKSRPSQLLLGFSVLQPASSHGRHHVAGLPRPRPAVLPPLCPLHAVSKALHMPEPAAVLHGAVRQDGPPLRPAQHRPADGRAQADGQLHHHAEAPGLRQHVQPGQSRCDHLHLHTVSHGVQSEDDHIQSTFSLTRFWWKSDPWHFLQGEVYDGFAEAEPTQKTKNHFGLFTSFGMKVFMLLRLTKTHRNNKNSVFFYP